MLDALVDVSLWPYAAAAAAVALDAVLPLIPGETAVIAAAVLASQGDLSIVAVVAAAVAGSLVGDSASYGLGATVGRRAGRRIRPGGGRRRRALDGLIAQLERRAPAILVAARFVPGGRTAATFTTGAAGLRYGAFAGPALLGAVLWSLYAAGLGYVGGEAFAGSLWIPLAAALVVAGAVAAAGEGYRRLRLAT